MTRKLKPVSPGEMLAAEFLKPLGMNNYRLAKEIGVPAQRIGEMVAGKRAITADTDLRLCRFFGLSDGWWLRLQTDCSSRFASGACKSSMRRARSSCFNLSPCRRAAYAASARSGSPPRPSSRACS